MSIINAGVRIVVSDPFEIGGSNLFGIITSRRKEALFVKLSKPLTLKGFTSDQMEFHPRYEKETFSSLEKYSSVSVNGALIVEDQPRPVFVMIATITLD